MNALHLIGREFDHRFIVEEIPVEVPDGIEAEVAAGGHSGEKLTDELAESFRVTGTLFHDAREKRFRE